MSITCTGVSPDAESWIWRYHCPAIRGESTRRVNETGRNSAELPDDEAVVNAIGFGVLGIEHDLVPKQVEYFAGSGGALAVVGEGVKRNLQLARSVRYLQVKGPHVFQVALPIQFARAGLYV